MSRFAKWVVIVGAATVLMVGGVAGCGSSGTGTSGDDSKLSAETRAYLDSAMPALEKAMSQWDAGNAAAAAKTWKSIGDIPANTSADQVMADDYLKYANNVRYYMVGDGSATLKDVEDSKANAESTLSAF
jgi:hypothetical protein